jgi:hypothetical protein
MQTQRDDETMKLRIREKYLSILLKKKDSIRQQKENQTIQ